MYTIAQLRGVSIGWKKTQHRHGMGLAEKRASGVSARFLNLNLFNVGGHASVWMVCREKKMHAAGEGKNKLKIRSAAEPSKKYWFDIKKIDRREREKRRGDIRLGKWYTAATAK